MGRRQRLNAAIAAARNVLQALALGAAFTGCTFSRPTPSRTRSAFWRRISQCGLQLWVEGGSRARNRVILNLPVAAEAIQPTSANTESRL